MFYLLEDNRIIDSEKYINSILNKGENSEKNYEYLYEIRNGQSYYYGKIKKQSENVFDLIEIGDLIKINFDTTDPTIIDVTYKESHFSTVAIKYYPETILAIYKPNSNGDYIKVWEKK